MENREIITQTPFDFDLERSVLGSIISNINDYNQVRDILTVDSFYSDFHRNLFTLFKEIDNRGDEPDLMVVSLEYQKKHNEIKFVEISDLTVTSRSIGIYKHVCYLNDLSARRKLIELGMYLQSRSGINGSEIDEIISHVSDKVESLYTNSDNHTTTIRDAIKSVYGIMEKNTSNTNTLTGTPTGFEEFDRKSGGFQSSDLIIIAGETSQGKTSFALSIVNNAALMGESIAIYSLEMKKEQCAARLMAINSGIPANELLYSRISNQTFERVDKSISSIYNSNIYFDDRSTSNIDIIINSIRSMVLKYGIKGAVIDYLQILNVNMKGANKEQQMADVARRLKNLAKDLDIWIVALSQLNRDNQNPVPNLNRLRDSGQITEAADTVMFVYRPEVYNRSFPEPFEKYDTNGYAMIDVAKGRNIGIFKMLCKFDRQVTHFSNAKKELIPLSISRDIADEQPF